MPLINGLKMACEPCIRGHRSTKCTHANERLMVPVRKPGRPLSACPHPRDQPCSCGRVSVTAAIPKKQKCHCGGDSSASGEKISEDDKPSNPASAELPSPTKVTTGPLPQNVYPSQFVNTPQQFGQLPLQPFPQMYNINPNGIAIDVTNGFNTPPLIYGNYNAILGNGMLAKSSEVINGAPNDESNGGSCCTPKSSRNGHSSPDASTGPLSEGPKEKSCCSSTPAIDQPNIKQESAEAPNELESTESHASHQFPDGGGAQTNILPQYLPQSMFAYPAIYGSYQQPLQPFQWQTAKANNQIQAQGQATMPPGFSPLLLQQNDPDSIHTCYCGDGCQCIGCAAHPYNDATQDYVRSAYASMLLDTPASSKNLYGSNGPINGQSNNRTNDHVHANGNGITPSSTISSPPTQILKDTLSSPPTPTRQTSTPSTQSPTLTNNDTEQTLSAADFFFVSYPFNPDSCEGDTLSCPCGDDCQCFGCTIHGNAPIAEPSAATITSSSIPCPGEKDECPCGDDCECIGCSIHNTATA
ncbi:hypothetical protein DH86_00003395 [Scytalidium sp. 3C]|nr:hypothetical protein DH86_00003395 [Scytalidium sp. 3C]